jgi:ribose transport system substrate-binding protein
VQVRQAGRLIGIAASAAIVFAACSSTGSTPIPTTSSSTAAGSTSTAVASTSSSTTSGCDAAANLAAAEKAGVLAKGPHGESAAAATSVTLTDAEITQVKAMAAKAAIVMHYSGDDWSSAQIAGLRQEFGVLGITVAATTDANFSASTQVSDIETVMTLKPQIIVSIPTDPAATASAYMKASAAGIKLVFMDNVPNGMTAGKDYIADVSADNPGNGVVSAHLMAKALGCKGKIGLIFHDADFFVTKQRYDGFKSTIQADYPNIQIVDEKGVTGPDFAGQAQTAAAAMLTQHSDLNGIWGVWDVPAEGVMAAARAAGRTDLVITTEDLGKNVAISLAQNGLIKGLGAQRPFDQGITEAKLAAYGLLGKTAPAYVALPALAVDHDNVLQSWQDVYHAAAPADVASSFVK